MFEIQARSEVNGLTYYSTLREAFEAAKEDETIWKISFPLPTGERVRLVAFSLSPESKTNWIYEPL